jgi:stearoyl-CoA desaturase (Delta-9 desaturase)
LLRTQAIPKVLTGASYRSWRPYVPMPRLSRLLTLGIRWFDSWARTEVRDHKEPRWVAWLHCLPFVAMHMMCLGVLWVGWSPFAVALAVTLYVLRMFAITGFYHRYFSHRTFKTSRLGQFIFALLGACAVQRGPLWWAAHHRHHHRYADQQEDRHSPGRHGFLWSHLGWFLARANGATNLRTVADLNRTTRHSYTQAASCEISGGVASAACRAATAAVTSGV